MKLQEEKIMLSKTIDTLIPIIIKVAQMNEKKSTALHTYEPRLKNNLKSDGYTCLRKSV